MNKLRERITRMVAPLPRTFALLLGVLGASKVWALEVPEPLVVWDGADSNYDFTSTTRNGYTLNLNNNATIASDKTYVQIGTDVTKPTVTITGAAGAFGTAGKNTVIIKCRDIRIDGTTRGMIGLLGQDDGGMKVGFTSRTSYVYFFSNGSTASYTSAPFTTSDYVVAGTFSNVDGMQIYVNGSLRTTATTKVENFTTPTGIILGGINIENSTKIHPNIGMKIYGVSIFDAVLTSEQIAAYVWPSAEKYQKWSYVNDMFTWITPTDGTSSVKDMGASTALYSLFDMNSAFDTVSYNGADKNIGYGDEMLWTTFSYAKDNSIPRTTYYASPNYAAPGMAMRLVSGYKAEIGAAFGPLTLGGLLVEDGATGYGFIQTSGSNRHTIFGDPRAAGGVPTWFVAKESIAFNRVGKMYIVGTAHFDIDENCTVNLNNPTSGGNDTYAPAICGSIGKAAESPEPGGEFIMHGLGNISVRKLTASGAKLDYSNLTVDRLDTSDTTKAYIQGNLVINGNTSFAFPAGMEKNAKYALCSGTLTNSGASSRRATISVGEDTFDAILTFDTSDATVSYVPIYEATIDGETAFSGITWTPALGSDSVAGSNFKIAGSGKVTGLSGAPASIEIDDGVTLDVTAIVGQSTTLSGTGTFLYTSSYPTTVPNGFTYEYVGSNTEASPATQAGVTVNGTLKTSGYLSLTTFSLASTGTLDVLENTISVAGAAKCLAGTVIVRENATLGCASNTMLDYEGTTLANIYGTLDFGSSGRWLIEGDNNTVNFYAGATIKGSGNGAAIHCTKNHGFNVKAHPKDSTKTTVEFQGKFKFNRSVSSSDIGTSLTVDEGVTLVFSGTFETYDNIGGYIRKKGLGTIKFSSACTATSMGAILSVDAGIAELAGLTFGATTTSGGIVVAQDATLHVSASSTVRVPLTINKDATLKIGDSASLTVSGTLTLPSGEGEIVTLDLTDFTLPTGTSSSTILTASATLDLDVDRFEFDGASSDYYLTQNTTTGAVSIKLHVAKGSDGEYRDNLMEAFGEIVTDHDLVITVLNGTGASNAELVKSANIAWDSENKQFLYGYAKIGSEPYISLAAAIEASTTGNTITLLRNTAENVTIKNGTTLSLNGFTVGSVSAESGYVLVPDDVENPTSYSTVEAKVSAEIGGDIRYFETLANALTAADGAGTITLIADCSENANLAAGVTLVLGGHSYTGELSGSGTVVLSSLTAPNLNASWRGTVELPPNQTFDGIYFDNYGVAGSTVRLKGANSGWFYYTNTTTPVATTIEIPQEASLTINGWSQSFANAFDVLKGAGTFAVSIDPAPNASGSSNYTAYFLLKDVSNFTGSLSATGAGIAIGDTRIANTVAGGKIIVSAGKTPTIASGATWQAAGGFTVDGTLTCSKGGKIYGTGADGTLALGGSGVIVNKFEGGSVQCFNAGAITVSGSLQVKMVGGYSNFGTWTLTDTASLGFDPGTDDNIWLYSKITAATVNNTIHIYGNGSNKVVENNVDGTKLAAISIHNGGKLQFATEVGQNDYTKWYTLGTAGAVTVDAGGEAYFYSRESYTRNTYLNGGKITLAGLQGGRSFDINAGLGVNVSENSIIEATDSSRWIWLRSGTPTFTVAENKTLTVNAGFKYDSSNSNNNLIKAGGGTMVVNGYVDGSDNHESFSQPKGVDIRAGTYELNAEQTSNGQTGANANFYTVASGAKLKIGATGKANTTTLNLVDGSLLEFGSGNATKIVASTVALESGNATLSFSAGVTPTSGTKLIGWTTGPSGSISFVGGVNCELINGSYYYLKAEDDGLYVYTAGTVSGSAASITAVGATVALLDEVTSLTISVTDAAFGTITSANVPVESVVVKYGEHVTTGAYSISKDPSSKQFTFNINNAANASVTISGNEIKVQPEPVDTAPIGVSSTTTKPTFGVKAIPGLWYALKSSSSPTGTFTTEATKQATESSVTLDATGAVTSVKYYKISAAATEADL